MMQFRRATAAAVALLAFAPRPAAAQSLSRAERIAAASGIWAEARYNYPFWEDVSADWDSAHRAVLRAAERPGADLAFYRTLQRFVALLANGDAAVRPSPTLERRIGRPPLHLRAVDGRPIIAHVYPTAETRIADLKPGSEIVRVQGVPASRWIRDSVLPTVAGSTPEARHAAAVEAMLVGERGAAIHLTILEPGGAVRGASLTRSLPAAERSAPLWVGRQTVSVQDSGPVRVVTLGRIAERRVAEEFERALGRTPAPSALVLDLRDAGGPSRVAARAIATLLVLTPVEAPRERYRVYSATQRAQGGRGEAGWRWHLAEPDTLRPSVDPMPFAGPLVVLVSRRTSGAGEFLAALLQGAGRGTLVGEETAGATGATIDLPLAGELTLVVCVAGDVRGGAEDIVGRGLEPDHRVEERLEEVRIGRNSVMERALALLGAGPANF